MFLKKIGFLIVLWSCCAVAMAEEDSSIIPPHKIIEISTEIVINHMKSAPENEEAKFNHASMIIEEEVLPYLDFLAMTKLAVGKFWKRSTLEQQDKLYYEFKTLLVRTYTKVFTKYDNLVVEVLPYRKGRRPDRAVVKTKVEKDNGGKNTIDYKFRLTKAGRWMVYDISVEGVSLVTNYRTSYNAEIARNGVEGLIKLLKAKNQ